MTAQAFYYHVADQDYETLKQLWNEYASETGDGEQIFDGVEDLAFVYNFEGAQLARMVFFGKLESWSDNVFINGYGNVESCRSVESSPISVLELAEWLEDSYHEFFQSWESEQEEESEE